MTETEVLRGARYATALVLQLLFWMLAVWYPLGITIMTLWWAFTEDDSGCYLGGFRGCGDSRKFVDVTFYG